MEDRHVVAKLAQTGDLLRDCWRSALWLEAGRLSWEHIHPTIGRYGNTGVLIREWYQHWALAGCRRLLDTDRRTVSVPAALQRLTKIAAHVTVDLVAETWSMAGAGAADALRSRAAAAFDQVTAGTAAPAGRLTKVLVQSDSDVLLGVHDHVIELTNQVVAHTSGEPRRRDARPVTDADISAVLHDVTQICGKWYGLTTGVQLSSEIRRLRDSDAMAHALRLFDHERFSQAVVNEATRRWTVGTTPPDAWLVLEQTVEVDYHWPEEPPAGGRG